MAEVFEARLSQDRCMREQPARIGHLYAPPVGQRFEVIASGALGTHRARAAYATSHKVEVVAFAGLAKAHVGCSLRSGRAQPHGDVSCAAIGVPA